MGECEYGMGVISKRSRNITKCTKLRVKVKELVSSLIITHIIIYKFKVYECEGNELDYICIFDVQGNFKANVKENEGNQILGKTFITCLNLQFNVFYQSMMISSVVITM